MRVQDIHGYTMDFGNSQTPSGNQPESRLKEDDEDDENVFNSETLGAYDYAQELSTEDDAEHLR